MVVRRQRVKDARSHEHQIHIGFAKSLILYASFALQNDPFIPLNGTISCSTGSSVAGCTPRSRETLVLSVSQITYLENVRQCAYKRNIEVRSRNVLPYPERVFVEQKRNLMAHGNVRVEK